MQFDPKSRPSRRGPVTLAPPRSTHSRGVTITREHRDALHDAILTDLGSLDDIYVALCANELDDARRLRVRAERDLALLDDLGWEERGAHETYELRMDSERLSAAAVYFLEASEQALRENANALAEIGMPGASKYLLYGSEEEQRQAVERNIDIDLDLAIACRTILTALEQRPEQLR